MKICVGAITRDRPAMLRGLLASYAALERPEGAEIAFVIVENNDVETLSAIVSEFAGRVGGDRVDYALETRRGIPYARNKVLDAALAMDATFLVFADDDETVDATWLARLVAECEASRLDLAGGPVRLQPLDATASLEARLVWKGVAERFFRREAEAARVHEAGLRSRTAVSTNNWIGRMDFFRRSGVRFDETIGLGSGSDIKLYRDAAAAGATTGWVADALVYEILPPERRTFAYQFARARDTAVSAWNHGYRGKKSRSGVAIWMTLLRRFLVAPFRLAMAALTGGKGILRVIVTLGDAVGNLKAYHGASDTHYKQVSGN